MRRVVAGVVAGVVGIRQNGNTEANIQAKQHTRGPLSERMLQYGSTEISASQLILECRREA